jgi:hypothetical protein
MNESQKDNNWRGTPVTTRSFGVPQFMLVSVYVVLVIVITLFAYNYWNSRTENTKVTAVDTTLVATVDKLAESWSTTEKVRQELKEVALKVSKENLELRKEVEVLKKKLGKYDQVQKALDEVKKDD